MDLHAIQWLKVPARQISGLCAAVALTVAVLLHSPAIAGEHERVVLDGAHTDQQFVAGEEVRIRAQVTDDIFAAGFDVVFDGASGQNILAAGHSVAFRGTTAQDLIVAGGGVDFAGEVADDMVAAVCPFCPGASRRLHLRHDAIIGDDARLAAGDLDIEGRIGGDLYAAARTITLSGEIIGNAELLAEKIVLDPEARIGGKLTYRSRSEADIAAGAVIGGGIERLEIDEFEEFEDARRHGPIAALGAWLVGIIALIALGAALQFAVPNLLNVAVATVDGSPWATLGVGFALFVATPVAAAVLFFTVIGIPLALISLAIYAVSIGLALVTAAYWLGGRIRMLFRRRAADLGGWGRVLWTAAGIAALSIVGVIPFLGALVLLFAVLFGLGAFVPQAWRRLRAPQAA